MALSARALVVALAAGVALAEGAGDPERFLEQAPGRQLQTNTTQAYDDVIMAQCNPGSNCSASSMPVERGLCVLHGASQECWDVCNPIHTPQTYVVGTDPSQNSAFAGLVAQVRAGLNSFVQCPGSLAQGDTCPPGRPCSYNMLKEYKVPKGRGMCVVDSSKPNSRACWDMCDLHHAEQDYNLGTSEGAAARVSGVRNGGGCPSAPWWPWVLVGVVIVCILSCCVAFVVNQRIGRKRSRGLSTSSRFEQQQEFSQDFNKDFQQDHYQDFLDPISEPVVEDRAPPEDYRQVEAPRMPEEEAPMPPEPQRVEGSFSGAGSMRIPGLDEPNLLFGGIQPLVVPQTSVAAPDLLSQVQPQSQPFLIPGNSQSQVQPPFRINTATSGQGAPTFSTMPPMGMQPPSLGQTVTAPTPPGSVQLRPNAQQLWTTQLVRR